MSGATYKYSIKAESGYKSDQAGKITPERHGVVCAALDGGLVDNLTLLRAAPDLLEALEQITNVYAAMRESLSIKYASDGWSSETLSIDLARAAIARAKGASQ